MRSGSSRAAVWLRAGLGLLGNGLASGCGQCVIWLRCADSNQGPAGLQRAALATAPCTPASNAAIDSFCGSPTDGLWMLGCARTRERGALKALALPPSHHPVKTKNIPPLSFVPPQRFRFLRSWLRPLHGFGEADGQRPPSILRARSPCSMSAVRCRGSLASGISTVLISFRRE